MNTLPYKENRKCENAFHRDNYCALFSIKLYKEHCESTNEHSIKCRRVSPKFHRYVSYFQFTNTTPIRY